MADQNVTLWAVGFFDLMGFRRELMATDLPLDDATPADKLSMVQRLERIIGKRALLTNSGKMVYDVAREMLVRTPGVLGPESGVDYLRHVDIKTTGFSDSVFLESCLDGRRYSPLPALHNMVNFSIASLVAHLGILGSPIRGGIDIAYGLRADDQLYSAATVKAVELEKRAKYPRILVGQTFCRFLEKAASVDTREAGVARQILAVLFVDPTMIRAAGAVA